MKYYPNNDIKDEVVDYDYCLELLNCVDLTDSQRGEMQMQLKQHNSFRELMDKRIFYFPIFFILWFKYKFSGVQSNSQSLFKSNNF